MTYPATLSAFLAALVAALGGLQDPPPDTLSAELPAAPPLGLELVGYEVPSDDAPQRALVALGRRLFFDPRLSQDHSLSCASCHRPQHGFADARPLSLGVDGRETLRNAPTLFNRALGQSFMWDGRAATLEEQVLQPIQNPLEMDLPLDQALARVAADPRYRELFARALNRAPDLDGMSLALAAFVRRLWHADSPVDRFRAGEFSALSPEEKAGLWVYESRGGCWRCHGGGNFTDEQFHNSGVGAASGTAQPGRMAVTGNPRDRGAFKTPTLRGLSHTGPYMHDGSIETLEEVVEFYRRGGQPNPDLDTQIVPLSLSDRDVRNLVAFLLALSRQGAPQPGEYAEGECP